MANINEINTVENYLGPENLFVDTHRIAENVDHLRTLIAITNIAGPEASKRLFE